MIKRKWGWRPSVASARYRRYSIAPPPVDHVDSFTTNIPIWDQGQTSSCVGHGVTRAAQYVSKSKTALSRRMCYWDARIPEGTTDSDSGATISDGCAGVAKYGISVEGLCPFVEADIDVSPSKASFAFGKYLTTKVGSIVPVGDLNTMLHYLARSIPVIIGFSVPSYMESDQFINTGWLPLPSSTDQIIGGHCVCVSGFDARNIYAPEPFLIDDNSWGPDSSPFGGRFRMPFTWVTDQRMLVDDAHAILPVGAQP